MITASSKSDLRFHCYASNISSNDFQLNLDTWGDSYLRAGAVAWLAIDGGLTKKKIRVAGYKRVVIGLNKHMLGIRCKRDLVTGA